MPIMYTPESPDNKAIRELRDIVGDLNDSTKRNNWIMGIFSFILVIIAIYQFILLIRVQIPFTKLQAQLEIHKVIETCKVNPENTWFDENGKTHKCSEMPQEWLQK